MLWDNACSTTTGTAVDLFASTINFLAATQCFVPEKNSYDNVNGTDIYLTTFHFIIVGGGSAGSIVANRLSEIRAWNVLLLEAGLEPPIESDIPQMDTSLYGSSYDWKYVTQNDDRRHKALKNNEVPWTRGKMLGGSSAINAMFYVRGKSYDFQCWADEGNFHWIPKNVNLYFKKLENYQNAKLNQDPVIYETYGHAGPLVVNTFNKTNRERILRVIDSLDYIGIKKVPDINSATFEGFGFAGVTSVSAANGQRQSTYRAYLKPVKNRKNLNIVINAFVTKILINNNAQAYGVEVDINGKRKKFFATLEVILSAGVINTPQLLMLSGIGNKKHLLSMNIKCLADLPGVGKNLQDHPSTAFPIYGDEPGPDNKDEQLFDVIKYLYNKTGYLAEASIVTDMTSFFSRTNNLKYPEFQNTVAIFPKNSTQARNFFNVYREDVIDSYTQFLDNKALYVFSLHLLHPFSRGTVYLNTSDPYDKPIILANYFGDKRDIQTLVDGMKILTRLLDTPYFKSINAFIHRVNIPQCNHYEFLSDSFWECYALQTTRTIFHPVGTAKMGPDPKDSVVNNFLQVHGVKKLRVIDASVMPTLTSGNTNAPTMMIAEMGSDMIKTYYSVN